MKLVDGKIALAASKPEGYTVQALSREDELRCRVRVSCDKAPDITHGVPLEMIEDYMWTGSLEGLWKILRDQLDGRMKDAKDHTQGPSRGQWRTNVRAPVMTRKRSRKVGQ